MRVRRNPKLPEGINASQENPLVEFMLMLAGLLLALVVLVGVLSVAAQWMAPKMPFAWEQRLASPVEEAVEDNAVEDDAVDDSVAAGEQDSQFTMAELALQELGQSLTLTQGPIGDIVYQFHLLDEDAPNAFATLGGHIFVTTGLLQAIESENGLAMVVAHEMAHINYRHPIQALSRGVLFQLVLGLLGADTGAVQALMTQTGMLTLLSFNRDMEREADASALQLLTNHYGHVSGAEEFFSHMSEGEDEDRWQVFFETHPGLHERLDHIHVELNNAANTGALKALDSRLQDLKSALKDD